MPHIVVADPIHPDGIDRLAKAPGVTLDHPGKPSNEELAERLRHADGLIVRGTVVDAALLKHAERLKVVCRHGVGYDLVDVPLLTKRGIALMITPEANAASVAEHALMLMLSLARNVVPVSAAVRRGDWKVRGQSSTVELGGRNVLIIGFGRIGTRTAKRCAAMEMNVLVYDPYKPAADIKAAGCEPVDGLDAALPRADFVSIHCPKTPETIGMFNAARLRLMKPAAYLINTARGGIVDEKALYDALVSGRLAGAGLDVFEQEPPPKGHSLFALANVITAPHVAGVTVEAVDRMSEQTARNLLSALDGDPIRANVINQDVLG